MGVLELLVYAQVIYHVPLLDFGKVFEMPILGYGGYIPFVWSIYQMLRLGLKLRIVPGQGDPSIV